MNPAPSGRLTISPFHMLIIALSLLMTLGAWQFSKRQVETQTEKRFEQARDNAVALITDRMKRYEDALWAGASTVESHGGDISYENWKIFAHTLRIGDKYPGISGIGVIHYLSEDEVPSYLEQRRAERPDFRIHPAHEESVLMPISYIEPEASNAAAVGLDVAHELNRRTAALATRNTGTAQITGPIVLVQDAGHTPGFLFYAPFYRDGAPEQLTAIKDPIAGAVYAPFVVRNLMLGLLAKDLREVRFSITDAGEKIYDEHAAGDPRQDANPMFSEVVSIDLYGRTWTLDIRTDLAFRAANTNSQPSFILLGGLIIEGLIIALLLMMARQKNRAVRYAEQVTEALRDESEKLAEVNFRLAESNEELAGKNQELEQFSYVTSHDLKTPIRGIGGLTEMVEEDLEDYFATPDANPEVRVNLHRIQERVSRMRDLTNGVMEFSKVSDRAESKPLVMPEAIEALISDFGLESGQLTLTGDVESVAVDAFNFRRVLENLIGNAIKYHDDPERLRVVVHTEAWDARGRFSVTDNGPGIDKAYHNRIFDMFQTLRTGDAPESTGIGLAIVKKAVSNNQGEITLTSSPGKGATFTFDWPLQPDSVPSALENKAA